MNEQVPTTTNAENARSTAILVPATDILEVPNAIIMFMDMPGADSGSLNVTLEKRTLSVSARAELSAPEGLIPIQSEFRSGTYERAFTVSEDIDDEHIEAMFKAGVLKLTLPKSASSPMKKIVVKAE